ncbi:MAG: nucleotide exchange factor GrpE [Pyrinomonadaceae bacterium]|nr:nucleotide exchange factor GrpE [Pyrinomonadaceae bacterium]
MTPTKKDQKANRIPVRFVDEEQPAPDEPDAVNGEADEASLSAEEIGRASSYEGETEVQRRIDRGQEEDSDAGREEADESDTAGAPPLSELPERREDQHQAETPEQEEEASQETAAADAAVDESQAVNSAPAGGTDKAAYGPMLAELLATRSELKRVEAERQELMDRLSRRQADFENYRKRTERERGETFHRMVGDVVSKLLPVMDNIRRALEAETLLEKTESKEFSHFLHGVELIYKQLNDILQELGVQPVAAVGLPFDPHVHEAVATEQSDDYEPDTVTQELLRGYRLGEKLLRPAMVKVSTR